MQMVDIDSKRKMTYGVKHRRFATKREKHILNKLNQNRHLIILANITLMKCMTIRCMSTTQFN